VTPLVLEELGLVNVVLVEDHLAVRRGLELLLRQSDHFVVGVAATAAEALPMIARRRPDLAVIDLELPDGSGAELAERVIEADSTQAVLVYTGGRDRGELRRALEAGIRGFALKAGSPHELLGAITAIGAGESYFDPRLGSILQPDDQADLLSPRQRDVLRLLAAGSTSEEAGQELDISVETVRTHLRNAMSKLEARSRTHAVALALSKGEIALREEEGP